MTITDTDGNAIDLVAVDQRLAGRMDVELTRAEVRHAVKVATARGMATKTIGRLLKLSHANVRDYVEGRK